MFNEFYNNINYINFYLFIILFNYFKFRITFSDGVDKSNFYLFMISSMIDVI